MREQPLTERVYCVECAQRLETSHSPCRRCENVNAMHQSFNVGGDEYQRRKLAAEVRGILMLRHQEYNCCRDQRWHEHGFGPAVRNPDFDYRLRLRLYDGSLVRELAELLELDC